MSYSATILSERPHLLAYYPINETAGTIAHDFSGNGYDATLVGATLGIAGAIIGDASTAASFTSTGGLLLPTSLSILTLSAISLEFWIDVGTGWQYVVATSDDTTISVYVNALLQTTTPVSGSIEVSRLFHFAGASGAASLCQVAIYTSVFSPAQVQNHFVVSRGYGTLTTSGGGGIYTPSLVSSTNPSGRFGIGTYQSLYGGAITFGGIPTASQNPMMTPIHPQAGTYGGTYGYVLDTSVRAPQQVTWTPAPQIGLDGTGIAVVRGYSSMTWAYTQIRPDFWYYLINTYNISARQPAPFQYLTLLLYPDSTEEGTPTQILARMDPPTHSYRTVGAYYGVTLVFKQLGQTQLIPGTPIVTIA